MDSRLLERCVETTDPTDARIPVAVSRRTCPWVLLPTSSPQRKRHHLPQHPSSASPPAQRAWRALGPPWAFFDPQRAEGEAELARMAGISGATVPSSGSVLSRASRPRLCCQGEGLRGMGGRVGLGHCEDSLAAGARLQSRCGSDTRWAGADAGGSLAHRGAPGCQARTLGGVARAAAIVQELATLELPPQGTRPEDPRSACRARSASGVPGVSGPRETQDPRRRRRRGRGRGRGVGVLSRRSPPGPAGVDKGQQLLAQWRAPRRVFGPGPRQGRAAQVHCTFQLALPGVPRVLCARYFCPYQRESGSRTPRGPFPAHVTLGIQNHSGWRGTGPRPVP